MPLIARSKGNLIYRANLTMNVSSNDNVLTAQKVSPIKMELVSLTVLDKDSNTIFLNQHYPLLLILERGIFAVSGYATIKKPHVFPLFLLSLSIWIHFYGVAIYADFNTSHQ